MIDVSQRYLMAVTGHNFGQTLRKLCGVGKPRQSQDSALAAAIL